jgi:hypothetical protein
MNTATRRLRSSTDRPGGGRQPRPSTQRVGRALAALTLLMTLTLAEAPPALASKGQFHVSCTFSHAKKDDPIVYPADPGASHLHDFFGNESTDAFSTYVSMRAAETSCGFRADTSGYWFPALLRPDGSVVAPKGMTAYYFAAGHVTAPPKNLRIIAGGDTDKLRISGYTCGGGTPTSSMPMNCGSAWLKGAIVFPSCWDGRRNDSADHRRHMAYPTGRGCPDDHPVQLPKIVLHITYGVHDARGFTLASDMMMGMTHGMSLHADFWNTWDQSVLEHEVDVCLNAGENCDLEN